MIEYREHITRQMLRDEPDKLFVFGDNLQRRGFGGQAAEMRDEPNAVGIPTKRSPSMTKDAFFTDADLAKFWEATTPDILRLLAHNGVIVWPKAGIGTGRAKLSEMAPLIFDKVEALRMVLE